MAAAVPVELALVPVAGVRWIGIYIVRYSVVVTVTPRSGVAAGRPSLGLIVDRKRPPAPIERRGVPIVGTILIGIEAIWQTISVAVLPGARIVSAGPVIRDAAYGEGSSDPIKTGLVGIPVVGIARARIEAVRDAVAVAVLPGTVVAPREPDITVVDGVVAASPVILLVPIIAAVVV
jgi:hypothetical protein